MATKKSGPSVPRSGPTVVFGDAHDPYINEVIFEHLFIPFIKILQPKRIIENGDGFDFYQASRFQKSTKRRMRMSRERNLFVKRRSDILMPAAPKDCEFLYTRGNHEERLYNFLCRTAPELGDEESLYWANYLKLPDMGWTVIDNGDRDNPPPSFVQLGDLLAIHGEVIRKHAGVAAKEMLNLYGESVLMNHTHKMGESSDRFFFGRTIFGYENGCMCDIEKTSRMYIKTVAKWVNMWSVVYVDEETQQAHVDQYVIKTKKGAYHVMSPERDGWISASVNSPVSLTLDDIPDD